MVDKTISKNYMKTLSYVTVSKNDNYDPDNIDKLILSITNNIK